MLVNGTENLFHIRSDFYVLGFFERIFYGSQSGEEPDANLYFSRKAIPPHSLALFSSLIRKILLASFRIPSSHNFQMNEDSSHNKDFKQFSSSHSTVFLTLFPI